MKKFSSKEVLVPSVSLFVISLVVTLLLAVTNNITAPLIEKLSVETEIQTRKTVLADASYFDDKNKTVTLDGTEYTYCVGLDAENNVVGYIFTTSTKGYGGEVKVMTGVSADGKVTGVEALSLSETAGLGMNAQKESFRNQYIGKSGKIGVAKNSPKENEIQALTGATITSSAFTDAVNIALELYSLVTGGVK